jgi:hypothetical protein
VRAEKERVWGKKAAAETGIIRERVEKEREE